MTDEERQRMMDFIVEQTAKNSVELDRLIESHRQAENRLSLSELRLDRDEFRLDRDERTLKLMVSAGRRERKMRHEADQRYEKRYRELLESQANPDSRLDALIDIVRQGKNGS